MNSEQTIDEALAGIIRDAPSQNVDFSDPANAFTVWVRIPGRMQFSGKENSLTGARLLADAHPTHDRYIVNAQVRPLGILPFLKSS
jgi:hypothetical protein